MNELQRLLQQCLKQEKMTSVVNEIVSLGVELTANTNRTSEMYGSVSNTGQEHNQHQQRLVYEQLIDMHFERLVNENAQLKVKLYMSELEDKSSIPPNQ